MGKAMTAAAENPAGGGAAEGMGLGVGLAMANQMMQQGAGVTGAAPPAPPLAAPVYHVAEGGQTRGPYSVAQLADAAARGQFKATSLVWTAGMAAWTPAGQVPQLAAVFGPPPPPPDAG